MSLVDDLPVLPVLLTVQEWIEWAPGQHLTDSVVESMLSYVGRNHGPELIFGMFERGMLTLEIARKVVSHAWSMAEFPLRALGEDDWLSLFEFTGYTADGSATARPRGALTLYRGAHDGGRYGWSWTDDPAVARWFADRPIYPTPGKVWVARVEPWALLARITNVRDGESEYVLDMSSVNRGVVRAS